MNATKIKPGYQDRSSYAWQKLCEYITLTAENNNEVFDPREYLGYELYSQIYTLPESIATLKNVKILNLYGSSLRRIPPEVGQMVALERFDPYTSNSLCWFPYEITDCKHLTQSRVSTRIIYGNFKNRKPFPDLSDNPLRYHQPTVKCSICKTVLNYEQVSQFWISLQVGSDILPLLANICSAACLTQLPQPLPGCVPFPHKGGPTLKLSDYHVNGQ